MFFMLDFIVHYRLSVIYQYLSYKEAIFKAINL